MHFFRDIHGVMKQRFDLIERFERRYLWSKKIHGVHGEWRR